MTETHSPAVERHCDVAVVGGGAAGLAAALQLGRQRRSVIVVDSGEPRNASAAHLHGFLGRDGTPPAQLLAAGREDVRRYGGEILAGRVERVTRDGDARLRLELAGGHRVLARRVIAATGIEDVLPDIEGLAEHWGSDVIHCPFCHGYEVRDQRLVAIVTHPMGLHPLPLLRQLTDRLIVVLHGDVEANATELDGLRAAGVDVRSGPVRRVVSAGGRIAGVELASGERLDADAVVVGPRFRARASAFAPLGLLPEAHPSGLGDVVAADSAGATVVSGVYAAGNITDPNQQVAQAAADGGRVGAMVSFSLADEDVRAASRRSGHEADWDHRYGGEQIWSGNPNGTLVAEATGLAPGRALDVGAGEGGDALWLAEHGWDVTAADISARALERVGAAAQRRDLRVACHQADANALGAFEPASFDLVSASYASIPRTPDDRGVRNIIGAVAPGGTLLVIGHDPVAMHAAVEDAGHTQPFDPDAYVGVETFSAALAGSAEWDVEVHDKRPRPAGAASASHHVDDVVLRARRADG